MIAGNIIATIFNLFILVVGFVLIVLIIRWGLSYLGWAPDAQAQRILMVFGLLVFLLVLASFFGAFGTSYSLRLIH